MTAKKQTPEQWAGLDQDGNQIASIERLDPGDWFAKIEALIKFLLTFSRADHPLDAADIAVSLAKVDAADQLNLRAKLLRGLQAILDIAELIPGDQPDKVIEAIKKVVEDSELLELIFSWLTRTNARSINAIESEKAQFQALGIDWETIRRIAELVALFFRSNR